MRCYLWSVHAFASLLRDQYIIALKNIFVCPREEKKFVSVERFAFVVVATGRWNGKKWREMNSCRGLPTPRKGKSSASRAVPEAAGGRRETGGESGQAGWSTTRVRAAAAAAAACPSGPRPSYRTYYCYTPRVLASVPRLTIRTHLYACT